MSVPMLSPGSMTLAQKIGQMFAVSLHGLSLEPETARMLEEFRFGSVYLYNLNYVNPDYMRHFCRDLQAAIRENTGAEPLLSGTYEGGEVLRFGLYNVSIPSARAVGRMGDPADAYLAGRVLGAQLADLGLNFNWAPILDLPNAQNAFSICQRSLSDDSERIASVGQALIRGMHTSGIGCAAKHFPGMGACSTLYQRGHFVAIRGKSSFQPEHIRPFQAAIAAGADAIVVGNYLQNIRGGSYFTGDYQDVCRYLREELGYDGVIATDAIQSLDDVPALSAESIVRNAIRADVDLLVFGYDTRRQLQLYEQIYRMVEDGQISEERLDQSVVRILTMKRRMAALRAGATPMTWQRQTRSLHVLGRKALRLYGNSAVIPRLRQEVQKRVQVYMPFYRQEDFVGFRRALNCCLGDVLCRYSGQVACHYYSGGGAEDLPPLPESGAVFVVCESWEPDSPLAGWVRSAAARGPTACLLLCPSETEHFAGEPVTAVSLDSLSDASIVEAVHLLLEEELPNLQKDMQTASY